MPTLAFQLDAIDQYFDAFQRGMAAAEAEDDDEESDIAEYPACEEELDLAEVIDA